MGLEGIYRGLRVSIEDLVLSEGDLGVSGRFLKGDWEVYCRSVGDLGGFTALGVFWGSVYRGFGGP